MATWSPELSLEGNQEQLGLQDKAHKHPPSWTQLGHSGTFHSAHSSCGTCSAHSLEKATTGMGWLVWYRSIQIVGPNNVQHMNDGTTVGGCSGMKQQWCLTAWEDPGYARRSPSFPYRPLAQCHCSLERVPRDQNYVALTGPDDYHRRDLRDGPVLRRRLHLETEELLALSLFTSTWYM